MMNFAQSWRVFLKSLWLQAAAIGLVATLLSLALMAVLPSLFVSFDWLGYDTWLRHRARVPVSPSLLIVTRDQASETKFGTGQWDRAILARVITEAHEAGAVAIGVDHRLIHASPAHLGGAASDALLLEATKTVGRVVYPFESESTLASDATVLGHLLVAPQQDHVTRSVHLSAELDTQTVPAFGLALFEQARKQTPSMNSEGTVLVNYVGDGSIESLSTLSFATLWEAIEANQDERLNEWFKDKVAVLLPDPAPPAIWLLPSGQSVTGATIHLHLLNMLLTDNRFCPVGAVGNYLTALLLASLIAWILLSVRESHGLMLAGAIMLGYGFVIAAALAFAQLVLPLALPLSAAALVFFGSTAWSHLTAGQQRRLLEQDMLRVQQDATALRDALVMRETRAEALEEDLATAQAAMTQTTGQQTELMRTAERLQQELADVRAQEEAVRYQLTALSQELNGLRTAATKPVPLGDAELRQLSEESRGLGIITQSRSVLLRFRDLKRGAKSELPILLLGEPGTGKELFARAAHRLSPRSSKPFIAVNMAAISPELFESEMFGHLRGSFTGATQDRRGYFELANHGTLFLDEIGDLRLEHQGKLLRVLQDKTFYRVGATTPTTVDVRIVAATNRDLQRGVTEGWFREDLYFRLTGLVFRLPSLHERIDDVPALAEHMLAEIARSSGRPVPSLSQDALAILMRHPWKGNVRELRHSLERAVALSDNQILTQQDLHLEEPISAQPARDKQGALTLPDPASDAAVLDCLRIHEFDMQATAKALSWDRSTVTQRLKGLCFQSLVETGGDTTKTATILAGNPGLIRTVELKVADYYGHLLDCIREFKTADEALSECNRRFKNLPDRHFKSVETLVRQHFSQNTSLH
jgi:transcriptional regulator with PAS, ATPase and Fis domain